MIKVLFECPKCKHTEGEVITWDRETVVECQNCKAWETMGTETAKVDVPKAHDAEELESWVSNIEIWNTLFELKEDDNILGRKGEIFFAFDFARDVKTDTLKNIIAPVAFNGMHLGKGLFSFFIEDEDLERKFAPLKKTFRQLEKEKQDKYKEVE